MLPISAALMLCAVALACGVLAAWAFLRVRLGSGFMPMEAHREQLVTLRRRYRRRLRTLRDALVRQKVAGEELREELRVAMAHQSTQQRLLSAAEAESVRLRGELATFERDQGLLRIERDELVARTQRLRALSPPPASTEATARQDDAGSPAPTGVSRTLLAERNARIHELECRLRESDARMGELRSDLDTWKYRIAPLTLHMQRQRERREPARPPVVAAPPDDLQRIRGIGRTLHRKLRDRGIERFQQLAHMGPAELANLAAAVGVAASRPQRDRWAEQARELATAAASLSV
ncbi:MAG: hypothetical protein IT486_09075 [Gammaproteobacteria bacterium]|nr:hypothetical protein [Gammaproteobacteria bacterium]